jgi:hypothetical protein
MVLPRKIGHQWWNAGDDEVHFRVEVASPGNFEIVLEVVSALAREGKMDQWGMPKDPFELANLVRLSESYVPGVPIALQKMTMLMVAGFGRLLGYYPDFRRYRTSAIARPAATIPSWSDNTYGPPRAESISSPTPLSAPSSIGESVLTGPLAKEFLP